LQRRIVAVRVTKPKLHQWG